MYLDMNVLWYKLASLKVSRSTEVLMLMVTLFFGFCTSMMIGNLIDTMFGVYSELEDEVWKMYAVTFLAIGVYGTLFWWVSRTWLRIRDLRRIQIFEEPWRDGNEDAEGGMNDE